MSEATFDPDAFNPDAIWPCPLRVWWIPQIPMEPFTVPVVSLREARLLLRALAAYDRFQFEHNVKPDYSNAGGLQENTGPLDPDDDGWYDVDDDAANEYLESADA